MAGNPKDIYKDEFEFKPLTEGLGFHKKILDIREPSPELTQTRKPTQAPPQSPSWTPALKNKDVLEKRQPAVVVGHQKQKEQLAARLEPVATAWAAAIFDSTMVLGLVLIFSAAIFAITKIDIYQLFEMLQNEASAQMGAVVLLVAIYEIYTVACRTFFGKTVGDSVFYFQLGTPEDQEAMLYPLQVAWRSFAIALTGFITLPLLSTLIHQDLAGILSGVNLYSEKEK